MLLAILLATPAHAGPVFASVDPEITIGRGGTWSRTLPSADGWWFMQASGGDFWADAVAIDFSGYDDQNRTQLSDHGGLQDVQVERCDDGRFLVLGSATIDQFDDSAYAFWSNADLSRAATVVVEEREDARAHNDMAPVCSGGFEGVAYSVGRGGGPGGSMFFEIGPDAVGATHTIDFNAMGGALAVRPSDGRLIGLDAASDDVGSLRFTVFAEDWSVAERFTAPVPVGFASWPQRLLPFGDGWLVTYVANPDRVARGGEGDVWVVALDADFTIRDSIQVTPTGTIGGRPWVSRNGDVLAVSYDREVQPRVTLVRLETDAVPDGEDLPDTAAPDDDDDDRDTGAGAPGACGCASSGASAGVWALALAFAALGRRAQRFSRIQSTMA